MFLKTIFFTFSLSALLFTSQAEDWSQWRGANRNGLSSEKNLLEKWPEGGPPQVWENQVKLPTKGGFSTPVVAEGKVFLFFTDSKTVTDNILCLDEKDGKKLWLSTFPGENVSHGSSSTPCVVDGRCYIIGSAGNIYSLDVKTGENLWKGKPKAITTNSSILVSEGIALVGTTPLTALDAKTGKVLWTQDKVKRCEASPVIWKNEKTTYAICMPAKEKKVRKIPKIYCVNLKTGEIAWEHEGSCRATPTVIEDKLIIWGYKLLAFKLSPTGLELLWSVANKGGAVGASPTVYKGRVYALSQRMAMCVDLETGKVLDQGKKSPIKNDYSSPLFADNKMFSSSNRVLRMHSIEPENAFEVLQSAKLGLNKAASPTLSNGKMYLRLRSSIACYDISKK